MASDYILNLDETWDTDIWPKTIIVSKSFNSEKPKEYVANNTAFAKITLSDDRVTGSCHCSNCGKNIDQFYNYCCYCGAKIVGKVITNR